jgi:hypothetical protein
MNLWDLGNQLVHCDINCNTINNTPNSGIIPRCLFFENKNLLSRYKNDPNYSINKNDYICELSKINLTNSIIAIGLNPSRSRQEEARFFRKNEISYTNLINYWYRNLFEYGYYSRLRSRIIFNLFGEKTNIIWSELVKCELNDHEDEIAIQTFRNCINAYLNKEIKIIGDVLVLAIGKIAYKYSALSLTNTVVGIPHPNSRGYFNNLCVNIDQNRDIYINRIGRCREDHSAIYLE